MNDVYAEARCRITWGDPSESVIEYLKSEGLTDSEALEVIDVLLEERHVSVKKNGIRKLVKTSAVFVVCAVILYFLCSNIDSLSTHHTRRSAGAFELPALGILWALWKGTDAILEIFDPSKFKGDVGINTD